MFNSLLLFQLQQDLFARQLIQGAIRAFLFAGLATKHRIIVIKNVQHLDLVE